MTSLSVNMSEHVLVTLLRMWSWLYIFLLIETMEVVVVGLPHPGHNHYYISTQISYNMVVAMVTWSAQNNNREFTAVHTCVQ